MQLQTSKHQFLFAVSVRVLLKRARMTAWALKEWPAIHGNHSDHMIMPQRCKKCCQIIYLFIKDIKLVGMVVAQSVVDCAEERRNWTPKCSHLPPPTTKEWSKWIKETGHQLSNSSGNPNWKATKVLLKLLVALALTQATRVSNKHCDSLWAPIEVTNLIYISTSCPEQFPCIGLQSLLLATHNAAHKAGALH